MKLQRIKTYLRLMIQMRLFQHTAVCLCLMLTTSFLGAQVQDRTVRAESLDAPQEVVVNMDSTLSRYLSLADSLDLHTPEVDGFRIQIFSSSGANSRTKAIEAQEQFLKDHSEVASFTEWQYPNWVVRVGNFRTRLEAQAFHLQIRDQFPASFITKQNIAERK